MAHFVVKVPKLILHKHTRGISIPYASEIQREVGTRSIGFQKIYIRNTHIL